jgi:ceramide glucosyltransferase
MTSAAIVMRWWLQDWKGVRSLWLLPFRDIMTLGSWVLAFTKRTTVWRESEFVLTQSGRLQFRENAANDNVLSQKTTSA